MALPVPARWQALLNEVPDDRTLTQAEQESSFFSAVETGNQARVEALLALGVPATLGQGNTTALYRAIGRCRLDIALLLMDHGAILEERMIESNDLFDLAGEQNHIPFAERLLALGATPGQNLYGMWKPDRWMQKSPEFVHWWVGRFSTTFDYDPKSVKTAFLPIQRAWLEFLPKFGTPDLAQRVFEECGGKAGTRTRSLWEASISQIWEIHVQAGDIDTLVSLTRLGLVPPTPLKNFEGEYSEPLLRTAIDARRMKVALWLAKDPDLMAELQQSGLTTYGLSLVWETDPRSRDGLLSLPLDWNKANEDGKTVLHALFDHTALSRNKTSGVLEFDMEKMASGLHCLASRVSPDLFESVIRPPEVQNKSPKKQPKKQDAGLCISPEDVLWIRSVFDDAHLQHRLPDVASGNGDTGMSGAAAPKTPRL
jgi:hypothetical protein